MIAGFIFLRLRGILGKKSGFEDKMPASFPQNFPTEAPKKSLNENTFDESAQKDFIQGAKIAYENIITSFSSGNLKNVKNLLDKKVYNQFDEAIKSPLFDKKSFSNNFFNLLKKTINNHQY